MLRKLKARGFAVFGEAGRYKFDLNIVAVRNDESHRKPDLYLDDLYVYWREGAGNNWRCFNAEMSTTPGNYYLVHPMRPDEGCAIMAAGYQYRGAYIRGLHKNTRALVQQGAAVKYYRDNNRDSVLDLDPSTMRSGYAGLQIHRGGKSERVGRWSAGCQILRSGDMAFLMKLADKQAETNSGPGWDRYTYTLIDEKDLR